MKFVIGDLHIGANWDGLDRSEDIFEFLKAVRDRIVTDYYNGSSNDCEVIFLGDIFDSCNVSHSYISRFLHFLNEFNDLCFCKSHVKNPIRISILKGNHDGEPDTRKGSPLQEVEAGTVAKVYWEPEAVGQDLYIPYCTQETLDNFIKNLKWPRTDDPYANPYTYAWRNAYTHLDIVGVTPGTEKDMGRGLPCHYPLEMTSHVLYTIAGHIHKPQSFTYYKSVGTTPLQSYLMVIGSVLRTSISEQNDTKIYLKILDNGIPLAEIIQCRDLINFDIDYHTQEGKDLYKNLLTNPGSLLKSTDIVSVKMFCPHNVAHEINQGAFEDLLRKNCYHLRFNFTVLKEKSFRMKDLDIKLSDVQMVDKYLITQGVSEKDEILAETCKIMDPQ